ncbi:MAG: DUF5916 domain-containing protein [Bacteroidales bacterium]
MKLSFALIALLIFTLTTILQAQTEYLPKKVYRAYRVEQPPIINGEFDDPAWEEGLWAGDFIQNEPYADRPPSQQTEFKIAFDDMNLYVAVRALDSAPDSITSRMSRRDNGDGDMVFVVFDSYHDLRTGFCFGVSSAGVRFDMIFSNNGQNEDTSWDPIWQAKSRIFDWGWGAEMKIPLTQLRFKKNSAEVWGLEVARQIFRHNEMSLWHPIPRTAPGLIHAMGELTGLEEIEPRKQMDLTPYGVTSLNTYEPEEGNPYADGSDQKINIGLDGKIGVTNNLTLDFTINPDFGQVEADPSEVNLSAYESYYREKRPFFIEGNSITSFNVGLGDGDVGNDNLFYSRRIGRRPHGYPSINEGEYVKLPQFTPILGAAKITGKTENGISVGIMEAVTADTKAIIDSDGTERRETVEPLTNYSLVRLQKDFNKGNTIIGVAATNVLRSLEGTGMDYLHQSATTAGLDFSQFFKDRNYSLSASLYFSNVVGSTEAISQTQLSSARYFQRPDANHLTFDSTLTSLTGTGGKLQFGKIGGNWNLLYMNVFKSPGLDINDMGYMREADFMLNVLWTGYKFTEPFSIFRSLNLNNIVFLATDFGGEVNGLGYEYNVNGSFKNFWYGGFGGGFDFMNVSNTILRGGPSMKLPNGSRFHGNIRTDDRKVISVQMYGSGRWGAENYYTEGSLSLGMTVRPMNTLSISLSPSYSKSNRDLQYVTIKSMAGEDRFVFGQINQQVLSMSLRGSFNITPDLTIEYWGQPFIASGKYSGFKMVTDPHAERYQDRYHEYTAGQISYEGGSFNIDEDINGIHDYAFGDPNFTVDEWLSNMVIRWEFLPGSTAFLVWSQTRDHYDPSGMFEVWDNVDQLFSSRKANNTIMLKVSYRIGLR